MNIPISESQPDMPVRSWVERNGFAHWALAIIWLIIAFIAFQVFASIVAVVLMIANHNGPINPADAADMMYQNLDLVFIGNSSGQILFLGLATWFFSRLHVPKTKTAHRNFLRYKTHSNTLRMAGATVVLIIAIQPAVWFLSWINAHIPVPEFFENMQHMQTQLIQDYLQGDHLLILTLFHVGLVPAICEETLYRGYVMRAFEKSWGIVAAIIVSGLLFGLYHVQLSNLLPLATIGMVLGFIAWSSDSIYPAMLAHLVNNGGSVLVGTYYPDSAFAELSPTTMPPVWAVALSLVVSYFLIAWMYRQHKLIRAGGTPHV